jgi:hypothetical protein
MGAKDHRSAFTRTKPSSGQLGRKQRFSLGAGLSARKIGKGGDHRRRVQHMRLGDAERKVRLLQNYSLDKGAFEAEVENATNLAKRLMERYGIAERDARPIQEHTRQRTSWVYWDHLFDQFGLELRHFGRRGNAPLGNGELAVPNLDTDEWHVQRPSPTGWLIVAKGQGLQTLNDYLARKVPKTYSMSRAW